VGVTNRINVIDGKNISHWFTIRALDFFPLMSIHSHQSPIWIKAIADTAVNNGRED